MNATNQMKQHSPAEIVQQLLNESPADAPWVFDCDGTLISGDVASHTAWGLLREGIANPDQLPSYWPGLKKPVFTYRDFLELRAHISEKRGANGVYEWESLLQAGCDEKTVFRVATQALKEGLAQGSLHFTDVLSKVAERRQDTAWIVSGSPQVCVAAVAAQLGIPSRRVIGTLLDTVDGIYMPRVLPPGVIWEKLKRLALEENGIYKPWLVAGDSIGDWYMMEMATHWCWCVVWDEHRHRGEEFRKIVQENVLGTRTQLPKEAGFYSMRVNDKNWLFEVRGANQKPW